MCKYGGRRIVESIYSVIWTRQLDVLACPLESTPEDFAKKSRLAMKDGKFSFIEP
jgi:hypothetical protein